MIKYNYFIFLILLPMPMNLNKEIAALLKALKAKVAANTNADLAFGQTLVENVEKLQPKLTLTAEEQQASKIEESKSELNEQLCNFTELFAKAYFTNKGEVPDWFKWQRGQKIQDFFATFFTKAETLEQSFLTWFDQGSQVKLAQGKAIYAKRKAIQEQEKQQSELTQKIQQAIDLRAFLGGTLRLFGVTSFEIRVLQQEES